MVGDEEEDEYNDLNAPGTGDIEAWEEYMARTRGMRQNHDDGEFICPQTNEGNNETCNEALSSVTMTTTMMMRKMKTNKKREMLLKFIGRHLREICKNFQTYLHRIYFPVQYRLQ